MTRHQHDHDHDCCGHEHAHGHQCDHDGPCDHEHAHDLDLMNFDADDDFVLDLDDAVLAELEGTPFEAEAAKLDADMPMEDRIKIYQHLRGAGAIPEDAGFFLVAWAVETVAEERVDELYHKQYAARFEHLAEEHGLDAEMLAVMDKEELPEEFRALEMELAKAIDALTVATFQAFGEHKMAALFTSDPDAFDERYDAGYAHFFGEIEGYQSELDEDELQD